jgi:naringenin degradation protein FdeD
MPEASAWQIWLCRAEEISEGESRGFDPDDEGQDTIFVVRFRGVLHAWINACPHIDGAPMAWRRDGYMNAGGNRVVCYAHGAHFMPDSGLCVQGPCAGRRLAPVEIVVDAGGRLFMKKKTAS